MPYGQLVAYRSGNEITIKIELPDEGELSQRGFAENLVDPRAWLDLYDGAERLAIKLTVCRPISVRKRVSR